ncbi:unnamed protein product [Camellia sinensis]
MRFIDDIVWVVQALNVDTGANHSAEGVKQPAFDKKQFVAFVKKYIKPLSATSGGSVGLMGLISQAIYDGGRHVLGSSVLHSQPKSTVGTPAYIAPEVLLSKNVMARVLRELPKGKWFCCMDCNRVHSALQNLVVSGEQKLQDSLLSIIKKKLEEKGSESSADIDLMLGTVGALGRLAQCFLDSLATLNYPAWGYGLRYKYGLFKQLITKDGQEEVAESWLEHAKAYEALKKVEKIFYVLYPRDESNEGKTLRLKQQYTLCSASLQDIRITRITKLEDANDAGGKSSDKCTLILTEGVSAKALAMAGISVVGRNYHGVFPLRGKLLNVRETSHKQIMEKAEIQSIKQILGLQHGKQYDSVETLRYGHLMIMTDQNIIPIIPIFCVELVPILMLHTRHAQQMYTS